MRNFWLFSGCLLGLLACQGPAAAQTMVEYGAAASASATAASASKGVSSSVGGMLDNLGKVLDQSPDQVRKAEPQGATSRSAKPKRAAIKPAAPAVPQPTYEDAMGIEKGMSCEDVTRRFGPPAMSFAGEQDARTMSYAGKTGRVQVECQGGKVASAEKSN
jgi:hypothetical protein